MEAQKVQKDVYIYIYMCICIYLISIYNLLSAHVHIYIYVSTPVSIPLPIFVPVSIITHILVESQSFMTERIFEIICPFSHFPNEKNMLRVQYVPKKYFAQLETALLQVLDVSYVCGMDYKWNNLPECFFLFRLQVLLITDTSEGFLRNHFHSTPASRWLEVVGPRNSSVEPDSPNSVSLAFVYKENGCICHEIRA